MQFSDLECGDYKSDEVIKCNQGKEIITKSMYDSVLGFIHESNACVFTEKPTECLLRVVESNNE